MVHHFGCNFIITAWVGFRPMTNKIYEENFCGSNPGLWMANLTKLRNGQVLCTYFNAPSHGLMVGDLICSFPSRRQVGGKDL